MLGVRREGVTEAAGQAAEGGPHPLQPRAHHGARPAAAGGAFLRVLRRRAQGVRALAAKATVSGTPLTLEPIGYVRAALDTKVEVVRQPRAGGNAAGRIELLPGKNYEHALLDLDGWELHLGAVLVPSERGLASQGAAAAQPLGPQGRVRDALAASAESARPLRRAPRARRGPHAARARRRHARRHAGARHQAVRRLHGRDRRRAQRLARRRRARGARRSRSRRSRCSGTRPRPSRLRGWRRARASRCASALRRRWRSGRSLIRIGASGATAKGSRSR